MKQEYIPYNELQKEYGDEHIPYDALLSTTEWKNYRDKIVQEDNHSCTQCLKRKTFYAKELKNAAPFTVYVYQDTEGNAVYTGERVILNVHHKYYVKNLLPWEYKREALLTVCANCHTKIHENESIKVFSNISMTTLENVIICETCKGTGYRDKFHYFLNGICFHCSGKGYKEVV